MFPTLLLAAAISFNSEEVKWNPGPSTLPPGTQVAVLEGDPKKEGLFTMRVRLRKGSRIMPHTHPREERVTVLYGSVHVGFGETFEKKGKKVKLGGYYVNPPDAAHYVWTDEDTILQITSIGPWELHYLKQ